jgi:menaquinone-dependent protoporphyrinogen oxidase
VTRVSRILLVYASRHGHTAKVAARLAEAIHAAGGSVDVRSIADGAPRLDGYDATVVGASVHAGHYQRELVEWITAHRTRLAAMPSAFFSVCLTAADDTDESRAATRAYIDELEEITGWTPRITETIAGALQYREYDFVTRLVMRLLMRKGGHPTDTSRDYDYTDWDAVDRFGTRCAGLPEHRRG